MHKGRRHKPRKPKPPKGSFDYINKPLSYNELLAMANQLVNQQVEPQREAIKGMTSAQQSLLGGLGSEVEGVYSRAAEGQSSFAKGYTDAFRQELGGAADVVYGTGGALPAGSLQAQGAAQASYARQLPGFAGLRGQQGLQSLQNQIPKLTMDTFRELQEFETQKAGLALNAQALGLEAQGQAFDQSFALTELGVNQAAAAGKNKKDKNKKRQEAWNDYLDNLDSRSLKLQSGKPNPNYNEYSPAGPDNPKTVPYSFSEAFKVLWSAYGVKMVRRGFKRARVRRAINEILASIGIAQPSGSLGGVTSGTGNV